MCPGLWKPPHTAMDAEQLAAHSRFFDSLVDLVPAKYYLDAGQDDRINLKYMKKSARDEAKAAFKQQYKAAKRSKLDPDQAKGTLALQKEAAAAASRQQQGQDGSDAEGSGSDDEEHGSGSDDDEEPRAQSGGAAAPHAQHGTALGQLAIPKGKPPSREELRERLQQKLEEMRKQRKAEEQQQRVREAKQWRDSSLADGRRRVGKAAAQQQQQKQQKRKDSTQQGQQQQDTQPEQQQAKPGKRGRPADDDGLSFNKLDFGSDPRQQQKKRRKASKQQLLAAAEEKQAAAAELAASQEGQGQLQREAWGAAMQRAKGERVLDDPRLLKKSIKKEAKMKAKKAEAWKERLQHQAEQQAAKQSKRRENIEGRIKAKQDKRKQKRENKLLRAGFEGRKQGFIETPKRPSSGSAAAT